MQVVDSLVSALLRADGDALVMHVGEKPTVITASGAVPLTASRLTLASMDELLRDLLAVDAQQALSEFGAVEADLPPTSSAAGNRLTVVAARGGDDVWIEIRRQRGATPVSPAVGFTEPPSSGAAAANVAPLPSGPSRVARDSGVSSRQSTERRPRDARWRATGAPTATRVPAEAPAVVLPLSRHSVQSDALARTAFAARPSMLERLLRLAADRDADALYLFAETPPSIRRDGEIGAIEGEPVLAAHDIDALLLEAASGCRSEPAAGIEWTVDIPQVGRVRAVRVRDQRGPGAVFRLAARITPAEQPGLSREIQTLCAEPEGLLLVTGPRGGGKSTLVAAMVDQINRTRREYVVAIDTRTAVPHENRLALVSQRQVSDDAGALGGALRAARYEGADVIAVDDLHGQEAFIEALEAAASGHLVIASVTAPGAVAALERLLERVPGEMRPLLQAQLARALRAVIAQVLLRKSTGGRVAAREVLLNDPSVTQLLAAGDFARLPLAIENGRRTGMIPLTDALVGFVQSGAVDAREAWRRAPDRSALLKALKREGIDTSFVERLA